MNLAKFDKHIDLYVKNKKNINCKKSLVTANWRYNDRTIDKKK